MAGRSDFTPDEWLAMRRAMFSAGVIVSVCEGGGQDMRIENFAILDGLRGARIGHPNLLVRELANAPNFGSGLRPGMTPAEYEGPALETIRYAASCVAARAPADLEAFQGFLVHLAELAANAHVEGGIMGVGGTRISAREAAAIQRIRKALGQT